MNDDAKQKLAALAGTTTVLKGQTTLLVSQEQFHTLSIELPRCRNAEDEIDLLKQVFGAAKAGDLIQKFGHGRRAVPLSTHVLRLVTDDEVMRACLPADPEA